MIIKEGLTTEERVSTVFIGGRKKPTLSEVERKL
jgi:hypothetical protein